MRNIHALIRKLLLRGRHPDEVRGNRSDPVAKRVFGLADPVQGDQDLRVRPTLAEIDAFRAMPDEEQLYCLNTYLRMVDRYSRGPYLDDKFILTLQNGKLRFVEASSNSEFKARATVLKISAQLLKNLSFKMLEVVATVRKATIYRNGKDDI